MRCLTLFYLQSCWDSHTWTYIIRGLQNIYIPSLSLSKMLIHFQSPWNITHVLAFPSFCPGPNTLLQDCTLSRTFLRHGTSIKMPVAWVLVNNERHVRTCGRKKSFVFVLFVSVKPRDWPSSTSRLSFYEDNEFIGFYGSNRIKVTAEVLADYLWNKFMTEEQILSSQTQCAGKWHYTSLHLTTYFFKVIINTRTIKLFQYLYPIT